MRFGNQRLMISYHMVDCFTFFDPKSVLEPIAAGDADVSLPRRLYYLVPVLTLLNLSNTGWT